MDRDRRPSDLDRLLTAIENVGEEIRVSRASNRVLIREGTAELKKLRKLLESIEQGTPYLDLRRVTWKPGTREQE